MDDIRTRQATPPVDSAVVELSIVMPCLNEAETLGTCIRKALKFLAAHHVKGEVIVADNGSTDGSREITRTLGARLVEVKTRGYGAALAAGIEAARGEFVVMGDSDDSYDFSSLMPFLTGLRDGNDIVMGNRFKGGIDPGAMPFLHRYLGNPVLSFLGRLFFGGKIGDFYCGLRGFKRSAVLALGLKATGMEFAIEMLVRAGIANLKIVSVPTRLAKDGRSRPPHLRTWRDGWRTLRFLLLFSPRWLFFYPGFALIAFGLTAAVALLPGPVEVAPGFGFDIHSFLTASIAILIGTQSITFGLLVRRYATMRGFLPPVARYHWFLSKMTLERILLFGGFLAFIGFAGVVGALGVWRSVGFGALDYPIVMRLLIIALTLIASGVQICMAGFLASAMEIDSKPF